MSGSALPIFNTISQLNLYPGKTCFSNFWSFFDLFAHRWFLHPIFSCSNRWCLGLDLIWLNLGTDSFRHYLLHLQPRQACYLGHGFICSDGLAGNSIRAIFVQPFKSNRILAVSWWRDCLHSRCNFVQHAQRPIYSYNMALIRHAGFNFDVLFSFILRLKNAVENSTAFLLFTFLI